MANIDKAEWHYSGNFPSDLPPANGATHIGIYLAWIVLNGLHSKTLEMYAGESFQQLLEKKITGRELLLSACDEKLFDGLLSKTGNKFTKDYYQTYLTKYDAVLAEGLPSIYHVDDTWDNYERAASMLDDLFLRWQDGERPPPDPQETARNEAQGRYADAIGAAAAKLPGDPQGAADVLRAFLSNEPADFCKPMAQKELEILKRKYPGIDT